jgi:hypothetical protein
MALTLAPALAAQVDGPVAAKLTAEPSALSLRVGDSTRLKVRAFDASGKELTDAQVRVFGARRTVGYEDGWVKRTQPAPSSSPAAAAGANAVPIMLEIPVTTTWPALGKLEIVPAPGELYVGVTQAHAAKGFLMNGTERPDLKPTWRSSNPEIATVDRFGNVRARAVGTVTITAATEGMTAEKKHTVLANPVRTIELGLRDTTIRTGDVLHLTATGKSGSGQPVANAPIVWSYTYVPDDSLVSGGLPGGAGIVQFGEFAGTIPASIR